MARPMPAFALPNVYCVRLLCLAASFMRRRYPLADPIYLLFSAASAGDMRYRYALFAMFAGMMDGPSA